VISSTIQSATRGFTGMNKAITCIFVSVITILSYIAPRADEGTDKANISCKEVFELIQAHEGDTNFVIIDFRPKEKYAKAHLENAIYYDVFSDSVDVWLETLDKDKTYLIYCTIGHRTGIALEKMREMEFEYVFHMYEGVRVWKEQGYKTLSDSD
jgi:rhodanese-related sulfurtransferase